MCREAKFFFIFSKLDLTNHTPENHKCILESIAKTLKNILYAYKMFISDEN